FPLVQQRLRVAARTSGPPAELDPLPTLRRTEGWKRQDRIFHSARRANRCCETERDHSTRVGSHWLLQFPARPTRCLSHEFPLSEILQPKQVQWHQSQFRHQRCGSLTQVRESD